MLLVVVIIGEGIFKVMLRNSIEIGGDTRGIDGKGSEMRGALSTTRVCGE